MKMMKLVEVTSRTLDTSLPEDKTHVLHFREPAQAATPAAPSSSVSWCATAEEASKYVIGAEYDVAVTALKST